MPNEPVDDPATSRLGGLGDGPLGAIDAHWKQFFNRLVRLAQKQLSTQNVSPGRVDAEAAVISAVGSFCRRVNTGDYSSLSDPESLWNVLAKFTKLKVCNRIRDAHRHAPNGNRDSEVLNELLFRELTPERAAELNDDLQRWLALLDDDILRQVAMLRMEGETEQAIADRIDLSLATVKRKVKCIREIFQREEDRLQAILQREVDNGSA